MLSLALRATYYLIGGLAFLSKLLQLCHLNLLIKAVRARYLDSLLIICVNQFIPLQEFGVIKVKYGIFVVLESEVNFHIFFRDGLAIQELCIRQLLCINR